MQGPGSLSLATQLFYRKKDFHRIYVYTVACVLIFFLLQLRVFENKPEWFSLKWQRLVNKIYTAPQHFENANAKEWVVNSESQTLEHDLAAMCFPKTFDMGTKVELTAAEAKCLITALSDKVAKTHVRLNIQTQNATRSDGFLNLLAAMDRNDTEVSKRETEELKFKLKAMEDKLRESVTFLPLKDTRLTGSPVEGRTWFMSTLREKNGKGKSGYFYFPSEISNGRILCVDGRHRYDGSQNSYGFAWPQQLPPNSTLLPGFTFVADNYYDYSNPWHSISNMAGFASWRKENECAAPERFVLYHWGELRTKMGSWISHVMHASMDRNAKVDSLDYGDGPVCFEKAVVNRVGYGSMTSDERIVMYDMIRCKVWKFCNVSARERFINGVRVVNLTLLARTGSRSFKNESAVASVLEKECRTVEGCHFRRVNIVNLSFCDQVSVMSKTDILATVHGAQLANLIFMERGSSLMEMLPKGWLEFAENGQYVFRWLADSSGMKHEGMWWDNEGPECPKGYSHGDCFNFYKNEQIGLNETYLASWTARVLHKFQNGSMHLNASLHMSSLGMDSVPLKCPCDPVNNN